MDDDPAWHLIARAAAGDPKARAEFVEIHAPSVRAFFVRALAVGQHDAVDDLVQEVFVECFKEAGALERADPSRDFGGFLHGLMSNVLRRQHESRRHRGKGSASVHGKLADESAGVDVTLDRRYAKEVFRAALKLIHDEEVAVAGHSFAVHDLLVMRWRDDKPPRAIAAEYASAGVVCSAKQIGEAVTRAKQVFRKSLEVAVRSRHPRAEAAEVESMCGELAELISKGHRRSGSPPVW